LNLLQGKPNTTDDNNNWLAQAHVVCHGYYTT